MGHLPTHTHPGEQQDQLRQQKAHARHHKAHRVHARAQDARAEVVMVLLLFLVATLAVTSQETCGKIGKQDTHN